MIEAKDLTKRYGDTLAVDDLSFTVHPGVVTGSPSTAVMSTTCPGLCTRSALLESRSIHPGEVPRLTCRCWQRRAPSRDPGVDEVPEMTGLTSVSRRAGKFSLGPREASCLTRPDHPADRRHAPPRRHSRFDKYNHFDINSR
jgi:ABC-2 type transport system ATP-binding protein